MLSRSLITRLALFSVLVVFAAGCATQPVASAAPLANAPGAAAPLNSSAASVQPQATSPQGSGITVVGNGTATGAPDQAHVSIGVQTQNSTPQKAVSDNQAQMNALLAALKALGIADADMRTSNYSVYTENPTLPTVADNKTGTGTTIYHVSNQLDVDVRDINKLADVLDKAVAAGANNIYGVTFSVADPSQLQEQARASAVSDAKTKAQSLASLEGITLGSVISISEVSSSPSPMIYSAAAGLGGGGGTSIQPGQLDVTVSIQVTYSIK